VQHQVNTHKLAGWSGPRRARSSWRWIQACGCTSREKATYFVRLAVRSS